MYERFKKLESSRIKPFGVKRWIWRVFAVFGNLYFKKYPPDVKTDQGLRLLNLGSGGKLLPGYVNADFYRLHLWFSKKPNDWMLDITKTMRCTDDYWDGVLIEHTNEHISYSENLAMLHEIFRTLKVGAPLRIVVPDLDKYLDYDNLKSTVPKMSRYDSHAEAISNLTQNHLHVSVWNYSLMEELLLHVGFSKVQKKAYNVSDFQFYDDSPNHEWQSVYIEAIK